MKSSDGIPVLTIITVCRNDCARLGKTVSSLSAFFDDPRFEHVVVDGESVDGTNMLVGPFLEKKNFRFYSGRDSGIYDAMNIGVAYSRAPLVLFLNCGDTIAVSPDELFLPLRRLVTDIVDGPDIACFPIQQSGNSRSRTLVPGLPRLHKMPTSHQGMVFARSFLLQNQYQSTYKIAGDYDVYLRAKRVEILAVNASRPLVSIELDGVASRDPFTAYREYLSSASHRLHGRGRLLVLLRIGFRAFLVVTMKKILPRQLISALRGL